MSGDQSAYFIYLLALLVFLGSAFVSRRVPMGRSMKMFGAWILIFFIAFIAFQMKDKVVGFARDVAAESRAETTGVQVGQELQVKKASDGHFWVTGSLNGQSVRFLVDSGATTTSISVDAARRAGIEPSGGFPVVIETANGATTAERGRAKRLQIGEIVRDDFPVHISESFGDTNVLGMNFLSSLSGWRVEGNRLILQP